MHVGRQVADGVTGFRPNRSFTYDHVVEQVVAFADGLRSCAPDASFWLLPSTSNHRLVDTAIASGHGARWQQFVASAAAAVADLQRPGSGTVTVYGGIDIEPAWSAPEVAAAWIAGYRSGPIPLWSNPSADGCPSGPGRTSCANGWNINLIGDLLWGAPGWATIPQIYRHDGVQADQWVQIARAWMARGNEARFAGVMTQVRACSQVQNRNCPELSLDPDTAREMLAAKSGLEVPTATDIGWG